jgi:dTDP-4-dehydrorhamnose 3,5-epimerase
MTAELCRTYINGVFELLSQPFADHRGTFLNLYRTQNITFRDSWGDRNIAQLNLSSTEEVGNIRGLHFQKEPHSDAKLVRCLRGRVWDVAVDLRKQSSTLYQWHAVELCAEKANALLIPEGCAHGFQVLEPNSQLLYIHSGFWVPEAESGIRWNDPELAISWPLTVTDLSDRDRCLPFIND